MNQDLESWDPRRDAFEDRNFNSYVNGPARNLHGTRPHGSGYTNTNFKPKNTSLYVTGIPLELTEGGLLNLFSRSGPVLHAKICKPAPGNRNSRDTYGFVKMGSIGDAERAIRDMHHFQLEGFQFKVKMALSEEERSRRKEEQLEMQNMFFNNDEDSDSDDRSLYQSNSKENQPQSMMNSHGDHVEARKGKGRGEVLSEITGSLGGFRSKSQQGSPRDRGGGMVMTGRGGANKRLCEVGKKEALLPTPSARRPVENLSIAVDQDDHHSVTRMNQTLTLDSLNRGTDTFNGGTDRRQMGGGNQFRDHYQEDGRLNQTYGGQQGGGMSTYPGPYGAAPDMYASYTAGSSGYGRAAPPPGAYPQHQQGPYQQPGSYPNRQPIHAMPPQHHVNNTLLQTVPPVIPLNSTFINESPRPQVKERIKEKPKVETNMKECTYCGKLGSNLCSKCKSPYCSRDCQTADWPEHKHICNTIVKEKDVADAFESKFEVSVGDELIPKVKKLMEQATGEEVKVTKKETKVDTGGRNRNHSDRGEGQSRSSNNAQDKSKDNNNRSERGARQDNGGYETDVERRGRRNDRGTGYETDAGKGKRACYNCGATDHVRQNCPKPHGAYSKCYNCQEMGHMSRECPVKQGQNAVQRPPSQQARSASPEVKSRSTTKDDWDEPDKPTPKPVRQPLAHSTPVDMPVTRPKNDRVMSQSNQDTPIRPQERSPVLAKQSQVSIPNAELQLNKEVAVVVTDPVSVNEIWLQDMEQTLPLQDTMVAMGRKFSHCPCDVSLTNLKVGDHYGAKFTDGAWYRVCVRNVSGQGDVQVHYIDFGNTEVTKVDNLRQLETSMMKQSAKAILCMIDGLDSTTSASVDPTLVKKHVTADVPYLVTCKDVDNGPERKIFKLSSMKDADGVDVLKALLSEVKSQSVAPAISSPQSVIRMKDIPHIGSKLQTGQQYAAIFSYVDNPNKFTVQILDTDNLNEFGEFDNQLQEFYNSPGQEQYRPTTQEEVIISKYSEDKRWYRAKVIDIRDSEVDVIFIDFGNSETTRFESCRKIIPEFVKFERKSILCFLYKISVPSACPPEILSLYQHFSSNIVMIEVKEVKNNTYGVELYSTDGKSYSDEFRSLLNQTEKKVEVVETPLADKSTEKGAKVVAGPNEETAVHVTFGELTVNKEIEVIPTDILSLRLFHVKIASTELDKQLADLMVELNQVCTSAKPYDPSVDEFVAAQFFDGELTLWYRGQVLERTGDGYRILYVDYGNTSVVKREAIAKLDLSFCKLPTMAISCSLKGAESVANDDMLLSSFKNVLNNLVTVKAVSCNHGIYDVEMFLSEGANLNSMLMDVISETDSSTQGAAPSETAASLKEEQNVSTSSNKVPVHDDNHKTNTPEISQSGTNSVQSVQIPNKSCQLKKTCLSLDSLTPVKTVHINSLSSFFVHVSNEESDTALLKMMTDLNKHCSNDSTPYTCQVMENVAALLDEGTSKVWYRAQVLRLDGAGAELFFVDFGSKDRVKMTDIRRLEARFLELPIMAVECSLAGSDGKETEACVEEFHSIMNHNVNLKVIKTHGDLYSVEMILNNPSKTVVNSLFGLDSSLQMVTTPTPDTNIVKSPQTDKQAASNDKLQLDNTSNLNPPQSETVNNKTFPKPPISLFQIGTPLSGAAMSIDSVHCFYIMLGDMTVQRLLGELMMELNKEHAGMDANYTPSLGEYVAAFYSENGTDEMWYRGVITEVCENGQFKVHYIDYGNSAVVGTKHIKRLDKQFLELPAFVTCCKLSGCEQLNEESARQFKAYEGVAVTVQAERETDGVYEVQLLNQDNKNVRDILSGVNTLNTSGSSLKSPVVAASSTELVDQLPRPKTPVSKDPLPRKSASPQAAVRTVVFSQTVSKSRPKGKEFEVVITSPLRPNLFHCHVKDQTNIMALKFLSDTMKIDCEEGVYDGTDSKFEVGELCCAKFIDGEWYRATILDVFPDNTVSVEYVDFGNRSEVNVEQLRPVRPEYTELSLLAFKCTLHGVVPNGNSWCEKAAAEFIKFADQPLSAKLCSLDNDVYELDLTDANGVNIAKHLIDAGVAKKEREQDVDDRELMRRENELLRRQLEQMQSQMAMLKMNQNS